MAKRTTTTTTTDGFLDEAEVTTPKIAATILKDGATGKRIMHLQVEVDFDGLRHKPNAKSAYQYVSVWIEGMRGVRFAGNLFIGVNRLNAATVAKAQDNYRKALAKAQDERSVVVDDEDKLG